MRVCNPAVTNALFALATKCLLSEIFFLAELHWKLPLIFEHHPVEKKNKNHGVEVQHSDLSLCRLPGFVTNYASVLQTCQLLSGIFAFSWKLICWRSRLGCCLPSCSSSSKWLIGTLVQLRLSFDLCKKLSLVTAITLLRAPAEEKKWFNQSNKWIERNRTMQLKTIEDTDWTS